MILSLPEPPSANRYWRHAKGRTYISDTALRYRWVVQAACGILCMYPLDGPVVLTCRWYRSRKYGDLDNRLKVLIDALRGYAYVDDKQIIEIHAYRYDYPKDGTVVVTIESAPQHQES